MTAKPLWSSENTEIAYTSTPSPPATSLTRKRKFDTIVIDDDGLSQDLSDTHHKTRRVNPQRLALRLGSELVAEMEEFIYPGAKMPPFDERRVLQEKYNVDRRHIYDYFHSRGLRVAKEDKHTNLTRGRMAKAIQKLVDEPLCSSETKSSNSAATNASGIVTAAEEPVSANEASPPEKLATSLLLKPFVFKRKKTIHPKIQKSRTQTTPHLQTNKTALTTFSPEPERPQSSVSGDDSAEGSSPCKSPNVSPTPVFSYSPTNRHSYFPLCDVSSENLFLDAPWSPNELLLDFGIDLPFHYLDPDSIVTIAEPRPLTANERQEMYNMVHNHIGPSAGIEESKGTYRKYMEDRSKRRLMSAGSPTELRRISQTSIFGSASHLSTILNGEKLPSVGINLGKPVPVSQLISSQEIFNQGKDLVKDDFSEFIDLSLESQPWHSVGSDTPQRVHTQKQKAQATAPQCEASQEPGKSPATLPYNNFRSFMFNARLRAGSAGGGI